MENTPTDTTARVHMPDAVNTLRTHILEHEYGVLQQTCLSKRRASGEGCKSQHVQGRELMQKLTATMSKPRHAAKPVVYAM